MILILSTLQETPSGFFFKEGLVLIAGRYFSMGQCYDSDVEHIPDVVPKSPEEVVVCGWVPPNSVLPVLGCADPNNPAKHIHIKCIQYSHTIQSLHPSCS